MSEGQTTLLHGWLERLRAGDATALDELLGHFEARLRALAHQMLRSYPRVRSAEETDDVLQNASLRLTRALRDLVQDRAPAASDWHTSDFLRLAALQIRRELIDLARRYSGPAARLVSVGDGSQQDGTQHDEKGAPEPAAGDTWDPRRIAEWTEFHQAAAALPEKARAVFDLLWYQGLSQAEAAAILGVDVRTVKSRWQDARLRLAETLHRQPGNAP
jgi:RNA polymerase sigma-70 factor (ECF subfamily)